MIRFREAIIVEGRYDKNSLAQVVVAPILETSGFGIFHASQHTQFTFYSYIELMSVFNNLLGQSYVFFVRQVRTVDHN